MCHCSASTTIRIKSKRSPSDHTYSVVALTNDSPRWPARVGEDAAVRKETNKRSSPETRLTLATTRSPFAWRLAHSKRLVSPLARKRVAVSSLELSSSKASLRSRYFGAETPCVMDAEDEREDKELGGSAGDAPLSF